jgi:anti-sigma B factor antagonist
MRSSKRLLRHHDGPNQREVQVKDTFSVSVESEDSSYVVSVTGEVDVATAPDLRERLHEVIADGPVVLVVDLLGVTFIDSTALGVLIDALKRSEAIGAAMRIVVSEPRILKVFTITGLTDIFVIRVSREEAMAG